MAFDLFLALIFMASAVALWYRISLKIPELVAISDTVIVERLYEDSARIRIFLLHFKTFCRERQHWVWIRKTGEKICYRFHIFLLRADNGIVRAMGKLRASGDTGKSAVSDNGISFAQDAGRENNYWTHFQEDAVMVARNEKLSSQPRRVGRIQEVRVKNKENPSRATLAQR